MMFVRGGWFILEFFSIQKNYEIIEMDTSYAMDILSNTFYIPS